MTDPTSHREEPKVTLRACPPGPFLFEGRLGFKTEYMAMEADGPVNISGDQVRWKMGHSPDVYVMASGECFWGGAKTREERDALMVTPVEVEPVKAASPEGAEPRAVQVARGCLDGTFGAWDEEVVLRELLAAYDAKPTSERAEVVAEPVGEVGSMPGTEGFTMAVFRAVDVPLGTKLYAASTSERGEVVACSKCGGSDMMMCDCSLPSAPAPAQQVEPNTLSDGKIREFILNWFAPWGAWKTAWWEFEVSDDVEMSDANALKHLRKLAASPNPESQGQGGA